MGGSVGSVPPDRGVAVAAGRVGVATGPVSGGLVAVGAVEESRVAVGAGRVGTGVGVEKPGSSGNAPGVGTVVAVG